MERRDELKKMLTTEISDKLDEFITDAEHRVDKALTALSEIEEPCSRVHDAISTLEDLNYYLY